MESDWPITTVSKLDTARSQFETAILLWFEERDPVSINTLTAAAHHVCNDLTNKASPLYLNQSNVPPQKWVEYRQSMCKLENFSKHAERKECDPAATISFKAKAIELYLLDGLEIFHLLTGKFTDLMLIFRFRFALIHPEVFANPPSGKHNQALIVEWAGLSNPEFLQRSLQSLIPFRP